MTTYVSGQYTWPGSNPSTTDLGVWLEQMYNACNSVGLTLTSDTGQYVPYTTTWPGTGSTLATGQFLFQFPDAYQSTQPMFLKLRVGRGGNYTFTRYFTLQIGTGTDGSGNLTGVVSNTYSYNNASNMGTSNLCQEYASFSNDGVFTWLSGYAASDASGLALWCLSLERSRNPSTMALDGDAISIVYATRPSELCRSQTLRTSSPTSAGTANNSFCLVPNLPNPAVASNGDKLLYPHFYSCPNVRARWSSFTARYGDVGGGNPTTLPATVNATMGQRTYINFGQIGSSWQSANPVDNTGFTPCFLWE